MDVMMKYTGEGHTLNQIFIVLMLTWFLCCHSYGFPQGPILCRAVLSQTLAQHGYRTGMVMETTYVCVCVCVLQIEQVSQLAALVQAQLEYHSRSAEILQQLSSKMEDRY